MFAGLIFVIVGFLVLIAGALGYGGSWKVWITVAAALISVIYSAVIYRGLRVLKMIPPSPILQATPSALKKDHRLHVSAFEILKYLLKRSV
ncbi:hypothetical protein L0244_16735 [bacterium]|nr:hypothetical protein [bacterium]MCI0614636.1 hypothetical protein [bacterium]